MLNLFMFFSPPPPRWQSPRPPLRSNPGSATVLCALKTIKQKGVKTSSNGIRTLPDGVTVAHPNRCTNYVYV